MWIILYSPVCYSLSPSLLFLLCSPAPVFYFGNTHYHVDESDGFVEVQVWRTGTDLSKGGTVTVRSRKTDPVSAEGMCPCKVHFSDSFNCLVLRGIETTENNRLKSSPCHSLFP